MRHLCLSTNVICKIPISWLMPKSDAFFTVWFQFFKCCYHSLKRRTFVVVMSPYSPAVYLLGLAYTWWIHFDHFNCSFDLIWTSGAGAGQNDWVPAQFLSWNRAKPPTRIHQFCFTWKLTHALSWLCSCIQKCSWIPGELGPEIE